MNKPNSLKKKKKKAQTAVKVCGGELEVGKWVTC